MFTGIITDIGTIQHKEQHGDTRLLISCAYPHDSIAIGASISCNGVCLTVVETGHDESWGDWFAVDVSGETLSRTTLGTWKAGKDINLERALCMGDELGGHLVTGHIDGIGTIESVENVGDSKHVVLTPPAELMPFVAEKGSICMDGVSLTINAVDELSLNLNIIPHTLYVTTLRKLEKGDRVNLEIDLIARYVRRMMQAS